MPGLVRSYRPWAISSSHRALDANSSSATRLVRSIFNGHIVLHCPAHSRADALDSTHLDPTCRLLTPACVSDPPATLILPARTPAAVLSPPPFSLAMSTAVASAAAAPLPPLDRNPSPRSYPALAPSATGSSAGRTVDVAPSAEVMGSGMTSNERTPSDGKRSPRS